MPRRSSRFRRLPKSCCARSAPSANDVKAKLIPSVEVGARILIGREFLERLLRRAAGLEGH